MLQLTQSLNASLAFFLFDQLSVVDRGFVFSLIKTYYKQLSAKISNLPDAGALIGLKVKFVMLHAQNVVPLLCHCRSVICLERLIAFSEFLHITYTKTTTLIKGSFGIPCGYHESTRQRCGSGATFCASSINEI
jgi:hypothetical protein